MEKDCSAPESEASHGDILQLESTAKYPGLPGIIVPPLGRVAGISVFRGTGMGLVSSVNEAFSLRDGSLYKIRHMITVTPEF